MIKSWVNWIHNLPAALSGICVQNHHYAPINIPCRSDVMINMTKWLCAPVFANFAITLWRILLKLNNKMQHKNTRKIYWLVKKIRSILNRGWKYWATQTFLAPMTPLVMMWYAVVHWGAVHCDALWWGVSYYCFVLHCIGVLVWYCVPSFSGADQPATVQYNII